jgi:hypothetical protein
MGELIYLPRRQDDDAAVDGAPEAPTSRWDVQGLLDGLERPLSEAFAQAASLSRKAEELRICMDGSPDAGAALDASLLELTSRNANSAREALLKAGRELTRLRGLVAGKAQIGQES